MGCCVLAPASASARIRNPQDCSSDEKIHPFFPALQNGLHGTLVSTRSPAPPISWLTRAYTRRLQNLRPALNCSLPKTKSAGAGPHLFSVQASSSSSTPRSPRKRQNSTSGSPRSQAPPASRHGRCAVGQSPGRTPTPPRRPDQLAPDQPAQSIFSLKPRAVGFPPSRGGAVSRGGAPPQQGRRAEAP